MTQLDVEEKRLSRQRWVETPTTRRTSDATEPILVVRLKVCKRLSDHLSTLVDPADPGGSTVSSRSSALWTGPHLGWQGDETGSRAFDMLIYHTMSGTAYRDNGKPADWRSGGASRPRSARAVLSSPVRIGRGRG